MCAQQDLSVECLPDTSSSETIGAWVFLWFPDEEFWHALRNERTRQEHNKNDMPVEHF